MLCRDICLDIELFLSLIFDVTERKIERKEISNSFVFVERFVNSSMTNRICPNISNQKQEER